MILEFFRQLFAMLQKAFELKRPEEVRKAIAEDKRPARQQKQRIKIFIRAWRFARRKEKIERKAKRKQLDDDLKSEIEKVYKE